MYYSILFVVLYAGRKYCSGLHDTSYSRLLGCHSRRTTAPCYHMQAVLTLSWMTLAVLSQVRVRALPRSTTALTSRPPLNSSRPNVAWLLGPVAVRHTRVTSWRQKSLVSWLLGARCKPLNDAVSYSGTIWYWMRSLIPTRSRFFYAISVHFCCEDWGDEWLQPVYRLSVLQL